MRTFVVLLRGVMPSGTNSLKMEDLRKTLEEAEFSNVRTYIQSGNVILDTSMDKIEIERSIHKIIKKELGPDLVVIAKTRRNLKLILNDNPIKRDDMDRVFYTMFSKKPSQKKVDALHSEFPSNELIIKNSAAYIFVPKGGVGSKLNNNFLETRLGVSATTRNLNTMTKLIELSIPQ